MVQRVASLESGGHLLVERQCEVNRRFTKFLEQIEIDQEVAIHPEQQFDSVDVEGYQLHDTSYKCAHGTPRSALHHL